MREVASRFGCQDEQPSFPNMNWRKLGMVRRWPARTGALVLISFQIRHRPFPSQMYSSLSLANGQATVILRRGSNSMQTSQTNACDIAENDFQYPRNLTSSEGYFRLRIVASDQSRTRQSVPWITLVEESVERAGMISFSKSNFPLH
jgi:hypothetical protein